LVAKNYGFSPIHLQASTNPEMAWAGEGQGATQKVARTLGSADLRSEPNGPNLDWRLGRPERAVIDRAAKV
jgi:hypothetical protein